MAQVTARVEDEVHPGPMEAGVVYVGKFKGRAFADPDCDRLRIGMLDSAQASAERLSRSRGRACSADQCC